MSVFAFSVWLLALLFSAVVGSWWQGPATVVLPLTVGLLGVAAMVLASMPWPARARRAPPADAQRAWADALCRSMTVPSLALRDGVVEVANRALLELLHYGGRDDEVVGLPLTNLVHPIDHEILNRMIVACQCEPRAATGMLRLARADGRLLRSGVSVSPLQDAPGWLLVQIQSADPAAEDVGRLQELVRMLDQLPMVLFQADRNGCLTYVNRAWERLSGRSAAQSLGLQLISMVHPEDRAAVEASLLAMAGGQNEQSQAEFRLVAANGSVVWVALNARASALPEDECSSIAGTVSEITRRKQLETSVGSTRRYLNTLLANVPGMVYRGRNDHDWTMEFVSDGCVELTGYEPYELVEPGRVSFGSLIDPQDREFVWTQVQRQLAQHKPYQVSYRIVDAQRQQRWVWEQGRGVFSAHGELLAIEGFITDVSARQGAEEQARRRMWFEARTGMLGRALFDGLLAYVWQHAQVVGYPYALFVVDLMGMPALQQEIGAERTQQALEQTARRFSLVNGPGAASSYLGAHQFAVLVSDFRASGVAHSPAGPREVLAAAAAIAARLAQALSAPRDVGDDKHAIGVVIGIALGHHRYAGGEAMLQAARAAAARAAALGPGHCEIADE